MIKSEEDLRLDFDLAGLVVEEDEEDGDADEEGGWGGDDEVVEEDGLAFEADFACSAVSFLVMKRVIESTVRV